MPDGAVSVKHAIIKIMQELLFLIEVELLIDMQIIKKSG